MNSLARLSICLFLVMSSSSKAATPTTAPARKGDFTTSFKTRNPLSDGALLSTRMGWLTSKLKEQGAEIEYDLGKESFEVRVPADYDGSKPFGLLVWISAGQSARPNRDPALWRWGVRRRLAISECADG